MEPLSTLGAASGSVITLCFTLLGLSLLHTAPSPTQAFDCAQTHYRGCFREA